MDWSLFQAYIIIILLIVLRRLERWFSTLLMPCPVNKSLMLW